MVWGMMQEAAEEMSRAVIVDIILPAAGWQKEGAGYRLDYALAEAAENQYPSMAFHREALETAKKAEVCPTMQSLAGLLRFWAKYQPEADMAATVSLVSRSGELQGGGGAGGHYVLPIASSKRLGGVKIGQNVQIAQDGTISVDKAPLPDIATDAEVSAMLEEVFDTTD